MAFCSSHCSLIKFKSSNFHDTCWMLDNVTLTSLHLSPNDANFVYSEKESIMAGVVIALQSIFGTILNFLVIVALLRNSELRKEYLTPTIISIAIANFIHSIYTLPILSCHFLMKDMPITDCLFFSFVGISVWFCSAWNLLGFSWLRCLAVWFPQKCNGRTFKNISNSLPVISWLIAFFFFFPIFLKKSGRFGLECKTLMCNYVNVGSDGEAAVTDLYVIFKIILITIGVLILILNVVTFVKVSKKIKELTKEEKGENVNIARRILEKEKQMGIMLASLSILYFLVYCPSFVLTYMDPYARLTQTTISIICNLMNWSIGVLDPLVYVICQKSYRLEIKTILQSIISCGKKKSTSESPAQMHRIVYKSNNAITLETVHE